MSIWTLHEGALTGPYHQKRGEESQDYAASALFGDFVVLAVADGAGSHPRSLEGATFVVTSLLQALEEPLSRGEMRATLLKEAALQVREDLLQQEGSHEMGCTLAVVVLGPEGWWAWVLGDAFVVLHEDEETHHLVQPERTGEFANLTELMTSARIHPLLREGGPVVGASASSDGLLHSTVAGEEPAPQVWTPLVKRALASSLDLQAFLNFMEERRLIEDDTTVLMAVRKQGGA